MNELRELGIMPCKANTNQEKDYQGWVRWLMPVIPAVWEANVGGSRVHTCGPGNGMISAHHNLCLLGSSGSPASASQAAGINRHAPPHPASFVFLVATVFLHVGQAGITGMTHCTWQCSQFLPKFLDHIIVCLYQQHKNGLIGWVQWLTPIIPALWKANAGRSTERLAVSPRLIISADRKAGPEQPPCTCSSSALECSCLCSCWVSDAGILQAMGTQGGRKVRGWMPVGASRAVMVITHADLPSSED
ncbi:hypothetical protein AAY473_000066 [Plecturocebus cupreus]